MPTFYAGDDDDGTSTSTTPPRGCKACLNGMRSGFPPTPCNLYLVPSNYTCPFQRWDTNKTDTFQLIQTNPDVIQFSAKAK
jgi:hypothetical protein